MGVAGVCGVAGCPGLVGTDPAASIQVGMLLDLSGELEGMGTNMRDAALLPLQRLETSELAVTVDYQVEDSGGQVETGVEGAEALVADGFPAILGAMTSKVTLEVAQRVFVPAGVVSCSPSATTSQLTELDDSGYVARTAPSDAFQGAVQAQVAIEGLDAGTAAVLFMDDDAYGSALAEAFENRFELRGGDVLATVPFEPEQASYSAELDRALAGDPDVLSIIAFTESGAVVFNDYYAEHQGHDIIVPDGLKALDLMAQVENGDLGNVVGTAPVASPNSDVFERRFMEAYGVEPTIFTAHSYDAAAVLMLASLAGDGTAPSIRDNLQSIANPGGKTIRPETLLDGARQVLDGTSVQYRGASGPVDFDRNGDIQAARYEVWEYDPPDGFTQRTTVDISS